MLEIDTDAARRVEAINLTPDVIEQRQLVLRMIAPRPGERVLDVGVGPGLLTCEVAAMVGPSGRVCGIDISASMLALASTRLAKAATPHELRTGSAEKIPYPDGEFDVAVSTQVLEYAPDI